VICTNRGVTVLLAILLALGVPFAQLHTEKVRVECCCPDPDHCKCPDHQPDSSGQSRMNACHKKIPELVRAHAATFVAPIVPSVDVPAPAVVAVEHVLPRPHAPPSPVRPKGPS